MTAVVEVRFKGNRKEYFAWGADQPPAVESPVIVEVERGQDLGRVSAVGETASTKCTRCGACGAAGAPGAEAAPPDAASCARDQGGPAQARQPRRGRRARVSTARHGLQMKVSDAEWQWDRRRLTIYFTADERVDFRSLVRDLAAEFRTRIELRQIGARDEAKRLDGIGRCGRQLCIASWLPTGRPVSLSLAKDQGLSLNPSQVSGPCGRLLCCLHYEHAFYVESRRRFPKEGKVLRTAQGPARVVAVDIFRDRVTVRAEDGTTREALEPRRRSRPRRRPGRAQGATAPWLGSTSPPPSTTRTATRTWGTPSRRSAPTPSRAGAACGATTCAS
jgi:cell fate regulator YaaT (PSP1 superfamily)